MSLNLPNIPNLFPNSNRVDQGLGNVRVGQATIVVATDGSGDTDNIQDAVNALPAAGGGIYIKEGTWNLDTYIHLNKPSISIIGVGQRTLIQITGNHGAFAITQDGCIIKNLRIKGNNTGVAQHGIGISSDKCQIADCWIDDMGAYGILVANGANGTILNHNHITDSEVNGIAVLCIAGQTTANTIISENVIDDTKGVGIWISAIGAGAIVEHSNISNNIIIDPDSGAAGNAPGILFTANTGGLCKRNIVLGNHVIDGGDWGIEIIEADTSETIISCNLLENCISGGINDAGTSTEIGHNIES